MNCSEARSAIGPDLLPTPASDEVDQAYEHYRECEACQRYYAHQVRLANRLKGLSATKAPPELRERVMAALEQEAQKLRHASRSRARIRWIGGSIAGAAAAAFAMWLAVRPNTVNPVREAAVTLAAIARDSGDVHSMTSNQVDQLQAWLATRIGTSLEIPDIPEAQLTGGQIARLDGVATAAVHYRYHGMKLTYILIPASAVSQRMPRDDELWSFTANGSEVVLWRDGETTRAVIAPMARPELEAIAEHCRSKAML